MLHNLLLVAHVLVSISLIGLVLVQQGKGADAGAAFGGGGAASGTMFGSKGSASFLTRTTGVFAALFFIISLSLAYIATQNVKPSSVVDMAPAQQQAFEKPKAEPESDVPLAE